MNNEISKKAMEHISDMAIRHKSSTKESVNGAKIVYHGHPKYLNAYIEANVDKRPAVGIVPKTTVEAVLEAEVEDNRHRDLVLCFGDYLTPGGEFTNGGEGQEESLCHNSNLYNILASEKIYEEYYEWNRRTHRPENVTFTSRNVIIPGVVFSHDEEEVNADVIVITPPDNSHRDKDLVNDHAYLNALKHRIEWIFRSAYDFYNERQEIDEKKRTLILGAFGCGSYGNDPKLVAEIMVDFINKGYANYFTEVKFAIPAGKTYSIFRQVIRDNLETPNEE